MKAVSRFEDYLLRTAYFCVRRLPPEQARQLLLDPRKPGRPKCLSRAAVELVQDALARGCVERLARAGGWKRERFLRGDHPAQGRLWQRTQPAELGLTFSRHALDFLIWAAATRPTDKHEWTAPEEELTLGDRLLLFFAYDALRQAGLIQLLQTWPPFARHGLCRLAFPEDFAAAAPPADLALWTTGVGACTMEALQGELAARLIEVERSKGRLSDWQRLRAVGQAQEQALAAFLEAAAAAERPDLARFVLQACAAVLGEDVTPQFWLGKLRSQGPRLADRTETSHAALALVRQLERLKQWERRARRVGYFDDGYARGQLWLADWERWDGDALHRRARALVQQVDPMKQAANAEERS